MPTSQDTKTYKFIVESKGFNQASLEDLVICIANLQDEQGLLFGYRPKDVLQPWILKYIPPEVQ